MRNAVNFSQPFITHSVFELRSRMKNRIFSRPKFRLYPVLAIALLSSLLRSPLTLASRALISQSESSSDDHASIKNIANWILRFLSECHVNAESPLIVAGELTGKITSSIYRSTKTTLALYTKSETSIDQAYARSKWKKGFYEKGFFRLQHKAKTFLVIAGSKPLLRHVIKQLKTSRWWNPSGLYLILDEELEKSSCKNAYSYLFTAWLNGLLSAVYLCLGNNPRNLVLHSYNPFENQAPKPYWKTMGSYGTGRNGHPWTLFRRELDLENSKSSKVNYEYSEEFNCDKIFFDKTRNLNGYPVRINAVNLPPHLVFTSETNVSVLTKLYSGEDALLARALWKWLNATIIELPQTRHYSMGFTDENDVEHGLKADLKNGIVDINLNQRYIHLSRNLGATYPHTRSDYCFLTKSRGVLPLWKNLLNSINPLATFLIIVIVLALIPLLVSLEDRNCTSMLFEILRMLVSASLVQLPQRFSSRFLIAGTLFLMTIWNGIFQGQIAAIVTRPGNFKDINTQDELEESGYRIHGYIAFENIIASPQLRQGFVTSEIDEECFVMAMHDAPVACAGDCLRLRVKSVEESQLYIAKEPLYSGYVYFVTRIDWPILDRINQLISRMVSAGLPDLWRDQTLWRMSIKSIAVRSKRFSFGPRPIRFDDVDTSLYLLLGGLLFATLVFGVEVALFRWKNKHLRN